MGEIYDVTSLDRQLLGYHGSHYMEPGTRRFFRARMTWARSWDLWVNGKRVTVTAALTTCSDDHEHRSRRKDLCVWIGRAPMLRAKASIRDARVHTAAARIERGLDALEDRTLDLEDFRTELFKVMSSGIDLASWEHVDGDFARWWGEQIIEARIF